MPCLGALRAAGPPQPVPLAAIKPPLAAPSPMLFLTLQPQPPLLQCSGWTRLSGDAATPAPQSPQPCPIHAHAGPQWDARTRHTQQQGGSVSAPSGDLSQSGQL